MNYSVEKAESILLSGTPDEILKLRQDIEKYARQRLGKLKKKGLTLENIFLYTLGDIEIRKKTTPNSKIVKLQSEILQAFCAKHGVQIYSDFKQIRPGDKIVTVWKHKKEYNPNYYDVVKINGEQYICFHTYHNFLAGQEREVILKPKDFLGGITKSLPTTIKSAKQFYLFY